jgi:glycosyltransferase involved in cell wall biosynthesis
VAATRLAELFAIMGMAQETLGSLLSTGIAVGYRFLRSFYGRDRQLLKTADGVFVTSPRERLALERYYLYPDSRIHTVPYGIEIGDLAPREKSDELRRSIGIPETASVVVTITDMTEVGEVRNLLDAFEQVVIKKPNARLIVVGDGPKFKEIEYEMLLLALGSKVIFTRAVKESEIPDYIALADVFVNLSARTTGFEPSLLEAMAQKKVIIGSEGSSMGTIVEHSQDGFLIRPADVSELSNLLLDIFAGQIPVEMIGEQARQKVLSLFDPEKMVIETLTAYYAILKNTGIYKLPGSVLNRVSDFLFTNAQS